MDELKVWGWWDPENNGWVGGYIPEETYWSFDRERLASELPPSVKSKWEVREMSDIDIAKIPGAAAAFTAWLNIQAARERLSQIRGQRP